MRKWAQCWCCAKEVQLDSTGRFRSHIGNLKTKCQGGATKPDRRY